MLRCYSGNTADSVWQQSMKALLSDQHSVQKSRLGDILELAHISFQINDPRQRWVVSRQPSINPAFAIAEAFALLAGSNEARFVNFWNPVLPKFAGRTSEYYGAYGFRLRNHFSLDQIEKAYYVLSNNCNTRQVVLQIWDPQADFPNLDGSPRSEDIPCNICSLIKVRNGKLEWMQIMRSNDLYRGTPYNFVQFTTLQEIMAGWLNLDVGSYCQVSDSLHLYKKDLKEIDCENSFSSEAPIRNNDDLRLGKADWDNVFNSAFSCMKSMSNPDLTNDGFKNLINGINLPKSYFNLICIAAADCARRHGWCDDVRNVISMCDNQLLCTAWSGWEKRNKH